MALQNNYTKSLPGFSDAVATDAYSKIIRIEGDKDSLIAHVRVYSDSNKTQVLDDKSFKFAIDLGASSNFIAQGYAHLKTLEQFSGATDV